MARLAKTYGSAFVVGLVFAAGACGNSGNDDQVGAEARASIEAAPDTAQMDPGTAQFALSELTTSTDIALNEFTGQDAAAANGGNGIPATAGENVAPTIPPGGQSTSPGAADDDTPEVNAVSQTGVSVPCPAAGNANVGGRVSIGARPAVMDVRATVIYDNCVSYAGTLLNGSVEVSQSLASNPEAPLQIETIYTGDVELSGATINATCPVDMNVVTDLTGRSVNVGGTFCGQDASTLNLQIAPRWKVE